MKNHLKRLRVENGWTQEEAAREAKVSIRQYVNWELGHSEPGLKRVLRLAKAFHCRVEDLYELEEGD